MAKKDNPVELVTCIILDVAKKQNQGECTYICTRAWVDTRACAHTYCEHKKQGAKFQGRNASWLLT